MESNKFNQKKKIVKIYGKNREDLINIIKEYVFNWKKKLTAKEIADHVNNILNTTYSASFIRTIMKKEMRLSFRRIKLYTRNIDFDKISWIRNLFAVKISKIVTSRTLLINIDESSLNRGMKINYSWGLKGHPLEIQNSSLTGSVTMIMAICSNGAWISFVIN